MFHLSLLLGHLVSVAGGQRQVVDGFELFDLGQNRWAERGPPLERVEHYPLYQVPERQIQVLLMRWSPLGSGERVDPALQPLALVHHQRGIPERVRQQCDSLVGRD